MFYFVKVSSDKNRECITYIAKPFNFFLTCNSTYEMPENKNFSFKDWAKKSHHRENIL